MFLCFRLTDRFCSWSRAGLWVGSPRARGRAQYYIAARLLNGLASSVALSGLLYSAQAQDTRPAVLIRTDAGSSPSFNASATRRYEGTVSRNDSEMARGESNA
jgi:hypothetical protein